MQHRRDLTIYSWSRNQWRHFRKAKFQDANSIDNQKWSRSLFDGLKVSSKSTRASPVWSLATSTRMNMYKKQWSDEAMKRWSNEAMKRWSDEAMKQWSDEAMRLFINQCSTLRNRKSAEWMISEEQKRKTERTERTERYVDQWCPIRSRIFEELLLAKLQEQIFRLLHCEDITDDAIHWIIWLSELEKVIEEYPYKWSPRVTFWLISNQTKLIWGILSISRHLIKLKYKRKGKVCGQSHCVLHRNESRSMENFVD
jgi:hypothetical protein